MSSPSAEAAAAAAEAPRAATASDSTDALVIESASPRPTTPAVAAVDPAAALSALALSVPAAAASSAPIAADLSPCSRAPNVPTVTIKLHAQGHTRRFRSPATCPFRELRAEVADLCKLQTQDFRIKFKVGEEDRVMTSDACVALAFAPALADANAAATTPGGPAVSKPVRLSVEMIGRVPAANAARLSLTRRTPSLPSAAAVPGSAGAASCVSESAGSSAVALAQAAISMSVAPAPLPINAASSSAAAAAVPEVSHCVSAMVSAIDEVAENRQERAAARVRSLLSEAHATWTLEAVQQQMRESGLEDDALLLPLVTPAMLSAQMDDIVQQRSLDAALCASVAFNPTPLPPLPPLPSVLAQPSAPAFSASASSVSSSSAALSSRRSLSKWGCELCSFHNVPALKCCQMCGADRTVQSSIVSAEADRPLTPSAPPAAVLSADAPPFEPIIRIRAPISESKAPEVSAVAASPAIVSPQPAIAPAEPSPAAAVESASVSSAAEPAVPAPVLLSVDAPEVMRPISPAIAPAASDPAPSADSSSASASASASVSSLASPISSSSSSSSTLPASPSTLELQQLREQLARMSEQMAQLLATQSSVSAGGSPSCSLSASSFGAPTTAAAPPSLSVSSAAPASPADSLVAAQLAQLLDLQHARFAEMEKSQQALQAKVLEMERQKLNRKRSGSVKTFAGAGAGGAAIAKHRQRSLSGVRSSKPGSQWGSGSGSLSSSQLSSPASTSVPTSVHSSPGAAPQSAAAAAALPTLDLQPPPLSASSASATPQLTSHTSPAILGSELDLSAYVKLSCLSELDLTAVTESAASSQVLSLSDAHPTADRVSSLPPRAPILSTIHSCSELEADAATAEESNATTAAAAPAPSASPAASTAPVPASSPSAALSAIPESNSLSPEAVSVSSSSLTALPSAIAASSSSSSSSLSPSSVTSDLSMSVDLRDDVRFPSVPDVRDREPKLDELAALGYSNRIFASMLLDMHHGDMALTIADLKAFYTQ